MTMDLPRAEDASLSTRPQVRQESISFITQRRSADPKASNAGAQENQSRRLNAYHLIPNGKRLLSSDKDQEKTL